jgi:hypothetical protein
VDGFRTRHAIVIGIDAYGNGIPHLRTAVHDARRIGQVLDTEFGYAVRTLTENVTLEKLRALLDESLPKEVQADDRLLVYFAGHGIALDGDDGPAGYLVPQDARPDARQTFLPMTDISGWLNRLPCRHLLLVLDCCFAGTFRWSSTRELGAVPEVLHKERFDRRRNQNKRSSKGTKIHRPWRCSRHELTAPYQLPRQLGDPKDPLTIKVSGLSRVPSRRRGSQSYSGLVVLSGTRCVSCKLSGSNSSHLACFV